MKALNLFFRRYSLVTILFTIAMFFAKYSIGQAVVRNPTNPWVVPAGVTSIKVEVWGSGGGGGTGFSGSGGGGGGGAYNTGVIAVSSGQSYNITIGGGGASAANGNPSTVSGTGGTVTANGGSAGGNGFFSNGGSGAGGTGGTFSGVIGGASTGNGAGGGGGAGNNSAGSPGGNAATGTGGTGNPNIAPYIGGNGGAFITANGTGNPGVAPGGGGGGGKNSGFANSNGGAGGGGQVIISYACPIATISYAASSFCKSVTSATATIAGSSGGIFSAIPATGLSLNTSTGEINPSTSTAGTYTVHYQIAGGNGCSAVDATASVTVNATPTSSVLNQTNITCFAANDGTITVSASSGTTPYTFSVDNGTNYLPATGTNLRLFTGLLPNTAYRIKVKDSNGCISK